MIENNPPMRPLDCDDYCAVAGLVSGVLATAGLVTFCAGIILSFTEETTFSRLGCPRTNLTEHCAIVRSKNDIGGALALIGFLGLLIFIGGLSCCKVSPYHINRVVKQIKNSCCRRAQYQEIPSEKKGLGFV